MRLELQNYSGGKVFIDFNIDGDFSDPGEEIGIIPYNDINTIGIPEIITFTVPSTGIYGPTRMRVVSQHRDDQNANLINPCDSPMTYTGLPHFGATEDYSIVLNSPASANIIWSTGQTADSIFSLFQEIIQLILLIILVVFLQSISLLILQML